MAEYLPRLVDERISSLLHDFAALVIVGPRATGKTTTAVQYARTRVQLDEPVQAEAFRRDPDAALAGLPEPVLLDEWQEVPHVLGAVKRAVDTLEGSRPGRFIVTGSVRGDLELETWPGTGRLIQVDMTGLSMRELRRQLHQPSILDRLVAEGPEALPVPHDPPDLRGYLELAVVGGFPQPALHLSGPSQTEWMNSYLNRLITRDAQSIAARDPDRLRRYFEALALNTAGVVADRTLYDSAQINHRTAADYDRLLRNLLVTDLLPAWASNRLKRLTRTPKRYIADPGLVGAALRADVNGLLRDGNLFGRMLDTFVVAQLRAEMAVCSTRPRLYHLRQQDGRHEIDILVEYGAHQVVGIEVKAGAVSDEDARHLRWLRDEIGDRFVAGLVLHTGPYRYPLSDRIVAAPICALWG
ncbi:MAG: ATP-binding protein [Pseudonocardiaceae bacterium]